MSTSLPPLAALLPHSPDALHRPDAGGLRDRHPRPPGHGPAGWSPPAIILIFLGALLCPLVANVTSETGRRRSRNPAATAGVAGQDLTRWDASTSSISRRSSAARRRRSALKRGWDAAGAAAADARRADRRARSSGRRLSSSSRAGTPPARAARSSGWSRRSTRATSASSSSPRRPTTRSATTSSWRFWPALPGWGGMAVFDRSWYGRVLVERVEGFATERAVAARLRRDQRLRAHARRRGHDPGQVLAAHLRRGAAEAVRSPGRGPAQAGSSPTRTGATARSGRSTPRRSRTCSRAPTSRSAPLAPDRGRVQALRPGRGDARWSSRKSRRGCGAWGRSRRPRPRIPGSALFFDHEEPHLLSRFRILALFATLAAAGERSRRLRRRQRRSDSSGEDPQKVLENASLEGVEERRTRPVAARQRRRQRRRRRRSQPLRPVRSRRQGRTAPARNERRSRTARPTAKTSTSKAA